MEFVSPLGSVFNMDSSADQELERYQSIPDFDRNQDVLNWWAHKEDLPRLGKLARTYSCIPATSVPSEQIFSQVGIILNKKRSALSSDHALQLSFLNKNRKI